MAACPRFRGAASVAKNHAAQIIPEASNVFRIGRRAVTLGELKELSLFALLGLDPLFHELNDDPVGWVSPTANDVGPLRGPGPDFS